jgi:DNA-binding CsgD family transcriptional regulator
VAVVGLVTPPKQPVLLVPLILWVAAYNSAAMYMYSYGSNSTVLSVARAGTLLDELSYFVFLGIFTGVVPGALYAAYPCLLIEAVAFDGAVGAVLAMLVFVSGFAALQFARVAFFNQPFATSDFILWSVIMAIVAASLATVTQVLSSATTSEGTPVADALKGVAGAVPQLRLSPREAEVLSLVAQGYSNTMIATRLHLSENTIKGHVESLLTRLNARNRAEAVAAASRMNLL